MSLTRHIWTPPSTRDKVRKLLGFGKTISEYLSDVVDKLADDEKKGWAKAVAEAVPFVTDTAEEIAAELPLVKIAYKIAKQWSEQHDPYEIGAVACTFAYQQAIHNAVEQVWTSAIGFNEAIKIDKRVAKRIRELAPAEGVDLSAFSYEHAILHPFVRRADKALEVAMQAGGFTIEQQYKVYHIVHEKFIEQLKRILTDKETEEKYAPFKDRLGEGTKENRAYAVLAAHAEYQRELFEEQPLFKYEPFTLKDVYIETQCGALTWGEIKEKSRRRARQGEWTSDPADFSPYDEDSSPREDLLCAVMQRIEQADFKDAIVIQGVAGSGKSSFTLRLSLELLRKGFIPIRIPLKRLSLEDSIIEALENAIELDDEDSQSERRLLSREGILLNGRIFDDAPYGQTVLSRFVLILDGWDELSIGANETFRTKVSNVLDKVRAEFIDGSRHTMRVRVIVTGRPSPDVGESGFMRSSTPILTLRPLRPAHLHQFFSKLRAATTEHPIPNIGDKRTIWRVPEGRPFKSVIRFYKRAFDSLRKDKRIPGGATEVLGYPLLVYLAVRVMSQMPGKSRFDELIQNSSRLYRHLIDLTCAGAGKFPDDGRNTESEKESWWRIYGSDLRDLLCHTAAAITPTGEEHCSFAELEVRLSHLAPVDQVELNVRAERATNENPLSKLVISFYFKGGHSDLGCEFAHKSFREYLFAEAIVATLKRYGQRAQKMKLLPARPQRWADFDSSGHDPRYEFSRELMELLAGRWLMPEVIGHLKYLTTWEINRAANRKVEQQFGAPTKAISLEEWKCIRDGLADLWEWWVDEAHLRPQSRRMPRSREYLTERSAAQALIEEWLIPLPRDHARPGAYESATFVDAHLGDGLLFICALVHFDIAVVEGWLDRLNQGAGGVMPGALWEGESETGSGPHRHQTVISQGAKRWTVFAPVGTKFELFQQIAARINSVSGRPRGLFPKRIYSAGTDFRGANLDSLKFNDANLDNANLDNANLDNANLDNAGLDNASLDNASLDNASLIFASLNFVRLNSAKLTNADLSFASLNFASLNGAGLGNANLYRASLSNASLDNTRLDNVSFDDTNLDNASLDNASLISARFINVDLRHVRNCHSDQMKAAYIDEATKVPPEWEGLKQAKLRNNLKDYPGKRKVEAK